MAREEVSQPFVTSHRLLFSEKHPGTFKTRRSWTLAAQWILRNASYSAANLPGMTAFIYRYFFPALSKNSHRCYKKGGAVGPGEKFSSFLDEKYVLSGSLSLCVLLCLYFVFVCITNCVVSTRSFAFRCNFGRWFAIWTTHSRKRSLSGHMRQSRKVTNILLNGKTSNFAH